MDVTWKPILTAIPEVCFEAYRAKVPWICKVEKEINNNGADKIMYLK